MKDLFTQDSILVGDFNSHSTLWWSAHTDPNGRRLENLMEDNNLIPVVLNNGDGTYIKSDNRGLSCLDLTFAPADLAARATWRVIQETLSSDHLLVCTTLNEKATIEDNAVPRWNFK